MFYGDFFINSWTIFFFDIRGTCCFKFNGYARAKKTFDRKLSWNGTHYVAFSYVLSQSIDTVITIFYASAESAFNLFFVLSAGTRNVPYSMWYQLPPWWRSCPQLVNCWNSFVCTFTSYFILQILTVKSTIDDMLARSFKIWGANTCCSIIAWWTFIKDIILHIQCDSVLDGGYWLLKRLVYNFYFPFTRRLSWHLGKLHLLDFSMYRSHLTSYG